MPHNGCIAGIVLLHAAYCYTDLARKTVCMLEELKKLHRESSDDLQALIFIKGTHNICSRASLADSSGTGRGWASETWQHWGYGHWAWEHRVW